jgi:uncharacterized membrane protein HdeD (DUF308 family)
MLTDWMSLAWRPLLARGLIGMAIGVVAVVWPEPTIRAVGVLWGVWALADGIATIAQAFGSRHGWERLALVGLGAVSVIAGFLAVLLPGLTVTALTWILGVWLVVRGLTELAGAVTATGRNLRLLMVLSGLVDGVIGVVLMANPGRAALSVTVLVGVLSLVWGAVFTAWALATWRTESRRGLAPGQAVA